MADKEHAEWAANQKARKDELKKKAKKKPGAAPIVDDVRPRPPADTGSDIVNLGF